MVGESKQSIFIRYKCSQVIFWMQFREMTLAVSILIKFSGPVGKKEEENGK